MASQWQDSIRKGEVTLQDKKPESNSEVKLRVLWQQALSRIGFNQAPLAHTCNPSYSGGRNQEDHGSKPAQANSSCDPISKKSITKKVW
jgi:hypothetical protein